MTNVDNELNEMRAIATQRIKKVLGRKPAGTYVLDCELFNKCGKGLRPGDWKDLTIDLCVSGLLSLQLSPVVSAWMFALKEHFPTSNLARILSTPSQPDGVEDAPVATAQ
jgi:hypothetical protein